MYLHFSVVPCVLHSLLIKQNLAYMNSAVATVIRPGGINVCVKHTSGSEVVKALCYKPEGRGFEAR
jgi:hypothetical protein